MNIDLERVLGNGRLLRALTSLDKAEFERLVTAFEIRWEARRRRRNHAGERRQRAPGAGNQGRLPSAAHKLLFILFYFKCYPLQEVMGLLFGFSQPQACEWVRRLTPLLNAALGHEKQLPARRPADLQAVLQECPELRELLIDGTERPLRRPGDKGRREKLYSGKKKRHTRKNVLMAGLAQKRVLYLSPTRPGREHDKKVIEAAGVQFPRGCTLVKDTGFQGYEPKGVLTLQPKKKPRGRELSESWRLVNRAISSLRVRVEHVIASVKRCRIVLEPLRNWRRGFADRVMLGACALHNLRLEMRAA